MSRKQIFANLTPVPTDAGQDDLETNRHCSQMPRRPSRIRPLMGSPDLVNDGGHSPVGALGQSLGELHERAKRAEEIEKQLLAGQVVVELDPTTVNQWIATSRFKKPELNKDTMSETLLRYKGAEAGEVDWRPTETIPEDYFAL